MRRLIIILALFLISATPVLGQKEASETGKNRLLIQQENQAFKEKVKTIKDQRKQKIAERINQQLAHINDQATKAMTNVLDRMTQLLEKLSSRVAKLKEQGKNTTAAEAAIAKTQDSITATKAAVEEQAKKVYVIEFTEESGLKVGASQAKTSLRVDLKALREKVQTTRQMLVDALKAVKNSL